MEREKPRRCGRDRFGAWTQVRSGSFPLFRQAHVGFSMKGLDNPLGGIDYRLRDNVPCNGRIA